MSKETSASPRPRRELICRRCGVALEEIKTEFSYLSYNFHTELQRCPVCRQAYIPEELAKGRMAQVEAELEDK